MNFRKYWIDTQKAKIIRIMLSKWKDKYYQDFEVEQYNNIFIWNNSWARMSELLKERVLKVKYFDNKDINWKYLWYKRAKYKLTNESVYFYKKLYFTI